MFKNLSMQETVGLVCPTEVPVAWYISDICGFCKSDKAMAEAE